MASIEVEPNEYKRGGAYDTLFTRDVFTCLVIAARIRKVRTGFMGHYVTSGVEPDSVLERVDEVTDAAAREAGNKRLVSIWLTGCAPMEIEFPEILEVRERVPEHLKTQGFQPIRELWLPTDEYAINRVALHCATASFKAPFVHINNWND